MVFVNDSFVEEDENVVDDDDCVVELVDEVAVDCEVVDCDDDDDCDTVDVVFVISLCLLGTAVLVFFVVDSSSSSIGYVSTGVGGGVVVLFVVEVEAAMDSKTRHSNATSLTDDNNSHVFSKGFSLLSGLTTQT